MSKNIINPFNKGGLMSKRSLLIYGVAVIVLIAVGGLVWWKNRSSADFKFPGGTIITEEIRGNVFVPDDKNGDGENDVATGALVELNNFTDENMYINESITNDYGIYRFLNVPYKIVDDKGNDITPNPEYNQYRLRAFPPGGENLCYEGSDRVSVIVTDNTFNVPDITLKMTKTRAGLEGFVHDSKTGKPIKDAAIFFKREVGEYERDSGTDENGHYRTSCDFAINKGTLFVKAGANGYKEEEKTIDISSPGIHSLSFNLEPAPQNQSGDGQGGSGNPGGANPGGGPGTP